MRVIKLLLKLLIKHTAVLTPLPSHPLFPLPLSVGCDRLHLLLWASAERFGCPGTSGARLAPGEQREWLPAPPHPVGPLLPVCTAGAAPAPACPHQRGAPACTQVVTPCSETSPWGVGRRCTLPPLTRSSGNLLKTTEPLNYAIYFVLLLKKKKSFRFLKNLLFHDFFFFSFLVYSMEPNLLLNAKRGSVSQSLVKLCLL